jgi:hypothetical protein
LKGGSLDLETDDFGFTLLKVELAQLPMTLLIRVLPRLLMENHCNTTTRHFEECKKIYRLVEEIKAR